MFRGFANVWTPVEFARNVRRKPVPVRLAGEDIVLFRGAGGRISALLDRCPHRGIALSQGKVTADGCIECPFHGWAFRSDGACARIPFVPSVRVRERPNARAVPVPVREAGQLIWIYTAPGAEAPVEPPVPDTLTDPAFGHHYQFAQTWNAHWTRAMEAMLDWPHLPFVHRVLGARLRKMITPETEMEIGVEDTVLGFRVTTNLDAGGAPNWLEWLRPNGQRLTMRPGQSKSWHSHVWCIPRDDSSCRMFLVLARNFGGVRARFRNLTNWLVFVEDKAIAESARPSEVPPPAEESSVAYDRPALAFRSFYYRALKDSLAATS